MQTDRVSSASEDLPDVATCSEDVNKQARAESKVGACRQERQDTSVEGGGDRGMLHDIIDDIVGPGSS